MPGKCNRSGPVNTWQKLILLSISIPCCTIGGAQDIILRIIEAKAI
jgi:hypothetical protein